MRTRRPLQVLHTADVHLDSDDRRQHVFRRIVDRALADRVDLLLVAGDLFDHNRVSAETIAFARSELDRLQQPVVILPGNHDALYTNAIYDRPDFTAGSSHIHVIRRLEGERIEFPRLELVVWGRAMEEHEPAFRPLAGLPAREDRWCVALGHGFFYEQRQQPERSSPIFADEIRDAGWDYIALGHQHVQTDISQGQTVAYYAGAPGLDGEAGLGEAAVLRIDFSADDGVRVRRRPI